MVEVPTKLFADLRASDVSRILLEEWAWFLDRPFDHIAVTAWGDWLLRDPSGGIWRLDVIEGRLEQLCSDEGVFRARVADPAFRDDVFLEGLIVGARLRGMNLHADQCYGFKVPPILGGAIHLDNVEVAAFTAYQRWNGRLHKAMAQLPARAIVGGVSVAEDGRILVQWSRPADEH